MNKTTPFFSIIIPSFNSEKTILACIQSILLQTFDSYEVLVMDNCSEDSTLEILKLFLNDKRLKIYQEKDTGVYDAMNKGIDKANGEWLFFLGSDDEFFDAEVLKKSYNLLSKTESEWAYGYVLLKQLRKKSGKEIKDIFEKYIRNNL